MKKLIVAAMSMLGLANGAIAEGTITNPSTASRLSIDLLGGQLPRMMVSYAKEPGATRENVLWDVYGSFRITYQEPTAGHAFTVHNVTDMFRMMIEMSGDELARFKDCLVLMSINQGKREIVAKLSTTQAISPWAQFQFAVEPGSFADSMIKTWAFGNLSSPSVTLPINSATATHFAGCTTNL
jgi:hypothetical protein